MKPNEPNEKELLENEESIFLKKSKSLLNKSVDDLDSELKNELYNRRRTILSEKNKLASNRKLFNWHNKMIPALSMAAVASVMVAILIQTGIWQSSDLNSQEDFELISTVDQIELYEDIEFYQWLIEQDSPTS